MRRNMLSNTGYRGNQVECSSGAGIERCIAGECELRNQEQLSVELPRIGAGCGKEIEGAEAFAGGHPEV